MTDLRRQFESLTTANVADGCVQLGVAFGMAPASVRHRFGAVALAGLALPVTHFGSVDVFLEAFDSAAPGDILVIANEDRGDEGCIGDLTMLEARNAGVAGVVLWGHHRDSAELKEIALPLFSTGSTPAGPRAVRSRTSEPLQPCDFAGTQVTREHVVFCDSDGVLFVPASSASAVLVAAATIAATERRQAEQMRSGTTLRSQLGWAAYLDARKSNPALTLREHLRNRGGAIEV